MWIGVGLIVTVRSPRRCADERVLGNECPVTQSYFLNSDAWHRYWVLESNRGIRMSELSRGDLNSTEADVPTPMPWNRKTSFRMLSTLFILPIADFVQPSAAMIGSISSRSGFNHSGFTARSYNACVMVCRAQCCVTSPLTDEDALVAYIGRCVNSCKVDKHDSVRDFPKRATARNGLFKNPLQ